MKNDTNLGRATCLAFLLSGAAQAQVAAPHLDIIPRNAAETARIETVTAPVTDFTKPAPFEANQGGAGTVRRRGDQQAFSLSQKNLSFEQAAEFSVGNGLFERIWVTPPSSTIASDGLGPLFNTRACQDCHIKDGRGHPPTGPDDDAGSLVVRLGIPTDPGPVDLAALRDYVTTNADPVYGHQFSDLSVAGIAAEGRVTVNWRAADRFDLPGGETVTLRRPEWSLDDLGYGPLDPATRISPRVAPQMIGLGLVEAIPAADIIALADPDDADGDGISGRANIIWSPEFEQPMLGRFGVRASTPTLRQQAADAFHNDIGIASPLHPAPWGDCTTAQTECRQAPDGLSAEQDNLEVSGDSLDLVTFYSRNLAVPARADVDDPQVLRGKQMFHELGCTSCHRPSFVTSRLKNRDEQSFQLIWPYSDFLLHDMGPGLDDSLPAGQATGAEWRTAPLWGMGLTQQVSGQKTFLHDGRARSLTEAVLWHGGEAETTRDGFVQLPEKDRAALIAFLESL
ncbi:MAG: c-type cytochrome [Paracoccus sp. (in: a-proteobacteria)]|nr:c-type cytochrome [Paracoccus sp. (in: a-proteobacteria)]